MISRHPSDEEATRRLCLAVEARERLGWHFDQFQRVLPNLSGHERALLFSVLPEEDQEVMWGRLRQKIEDRRYADDLIEFPRRRPTRRPVRSVPRAAGTQPQTTDDPLRSVLPPDYFEALAGVEIPSRGGVVHCCLPGHDDRTPSLKVWPHPDKGFHCFGCGRGGTIYDLGRELSGLPDRGPGFIELRDWIAERVLGAAYAGAAQ